MSFINSQKKEINCKIVYYGPDFSGKATTLRHIYEKTAPGNRGKIVSLSDEQDRTLFFDFLPLSMGKIKDYTIRFHLYTVPGQVLYDSARKLILRGIDGVIFMVDSQIERLEENLESWKHLQANLASHDVDFHTVPMALQFNKRDLPKTLPTTEMRQLFNHRNLPEFETTATKGRGVMECFQSVAKQVLKELKKS